MAVNTQTNEPIDPIKQIGGDATATFENDPKFTEPTPGSEGSSENLAAKDTDDVEDEDELDEEDEDVDDEDDDLEDDDDEDEEDDDEEYEDDEDDEDEDEDDDEDDEDEVAAAPAEMRADGLLGYEDEADDEAKGRSIGQGDATRARAESKLDQPGTNRGTSRPTDTDDDAGDVNMGVSEEEITEDDLDTDRIAAAAMNVFAHHAAAMSQQSL